MLAVYDRNKELLIRSSMSLFYLFSLSVHKFCDIERMVIFLCMSDHLGATIVVGNWI